MKGKSMSDREVIKAAMTIIGRRSTPAKAKAARKNGKLGGRPRKAVAA